MKLSATNHLLTSGVHPAGKSGNGPSRDLEDRFERQEPSLSNCRKAAFTAGVGLPLLAVGGLLGAGGLGPVVGAYRSGGLGQVVGDLPSNWAAAVTGNKVAMVTLGVVVGFAAYHALRDRQSQ